MSNDWNNCCCREKETCSQNRCEENECWHPSQCCACASITIPCPRRRRYEVSSCYNPCTADCD